jgi:hypothetical protein
MIQIPDIWKIYTFVLFGVGIGYLGAQDSKNLFILGIPMALLIHNTKFSCYTEKIKFERQRSINLVLTIFRDVIVLARNWDSENMDSMKEKVQEILRNIMGGMDLQSLFMTGVSAFMT